MVCTTGSRGVRRVRYNGQYYRLEKSRQCAVLRLARPLGGESGGSGITVSTTCWRESGKSGITVSMTGWKGVRRVRFNG